MSKIKLAPRVARAAALLVPRACFFWSNSPSVPGAATHWPGGRGKSSRSRVALTWEEPRFSAMNCLPPGRKISGFTARRYPGPCALYTLGSFVVTNGSIRSGFAVGVDRSSCVAATVRPFKVSAGDSRRLFRPSATMACSTAPSLSSHDKLHSSGRGTSSSIGCPWLPALTINSRLYSHASQSISLARDSSPEQKDAPSHLPIS